MQTGGKLRVGTRGSDLARAQVDLFAAALCAVSPQIELETVVITTSGDENSRCPIADVHAGRKGMFTREIECALLDGRINVAVHSAKDMPSEMDERLTIAAVLQRASADDVLVTKAGETFETLAPGAIIGSGSVRRKYQAQAWRADIEIRDVRGNVPTRLRKLAGSDWAGIILARAGLERLGFPLGHFIFDGIALSASSLPHDQFVPAGGQGIIAIQTRADDAQTREALAGINHRDTHLCLSAEREFLRLLEVDCNAPVGVHASTRDECISMTAQLFEPQYRLATVTAAEPLDGAAELFALVNR